jgi:hypothetical protein
VSIGDTLTQARHRAGLTLGQVSEQTCIRETIIRGLERGDYSACGGDFYARGHIRSVARAVGIDPEPLVSEYDASHPQRDGLTAAEVFEPAKPLRFAQRRRFNWTVLLALALIVVAGLAAFKLATTHHPARTVPHRPATAHPVKPHHAAPAAATHRPRLVIHLVASQSCWVRLTTAAGHTIYTGTIAAGRAMSWVERQRVRLVLGNPSGVALTVNGRNAVPPGSAGALTLSLRPGRFGS